MGSLAPADRDPSLQLGDPMPNGLASQHRIALLAKDVQAKVPAEPEGLYALGVFAALRCIAQRGPTFAQAARLEAEEWAPIFQPVPSPPRRLVAHGGGEAPWWPSWNTEDQR